MASLRSPKNPIRVELSYDKPLVGIGSVESFTTTTIEAAKSMALGTAKRNRATAHVTIWRNEAGYPKFDWHKVDDFFATADGEVDVRRTIGSRVLQCRLEADMTQQQLADKCGMQRPNIARIEAGRYGMTVDVLARIAQALGKTIDLV